MVWPTDSYYFSIHALGGEAGLNRFMLVSLIEFGKRLNPEKGLV